VGELRYNLAADTWLLDDASGGSGGSGGIPATIVDAKGDLLVATAADTVARLPVGTDGQVLKASSGTSTGLVWSTDITGSGSSAVIEAAANGVTFNGSTETRTSLNALLAGLADGAVVGFPPGGVAIISANVSIPSGVDNITILGRGATLKLSGSAASAAFVLNLVGSGAKITDLTIDASSIANSTGIRINGNGHTIRGCTFTNSVAGGVYVEGASTNLSITESVFGQGYGILVKDDSTANGIVIANNRFIGSTHGDAIEINTPASASTGAHDITITGNLITGYTDASSQTGIGIGVANAHNVAISGNTILNTKLDGIHVEDACKGVTVTGNTIRGAGRSGISINAGAGTTSPFGWVISGNLVEECGKTGGNGGIACEGIVSVRNGTITGNTVVNCGYSAADPYFYGISLGYQSKDIVCSGNYVSGTIGPTASGIGWHDGECFTITGNICQHRGGTAQKYGIRVEGVQTSVVVSSNILTPNATAAMDESNMDASTSYLKYLNMPTSVNQTL
jgi:parallel beta-helix repeat protein